jgi:hypothetical protein
MFYLSFGGQSHVKTPCFPRLIAAFIHAKASQRSGHYTDKVQEGKRFFEGFPLSLASNTRQHGKRHKNLILYRVGDGNQPTRR